MTNIDLNKKLFQELSLLDLPVDQFIVVASGPLGIRGLRSMSDVDILVTDKLWSSLQNSNNKYTENGVQKLKLSENVDAMYSGSFEIKNNNSIAVSEQLGSREIIDGLPFQSLESVLYFKKMGTREKDKADVKLIEGWIREHS